MSEPGIEHETRRDLSGPPQGYFVVVPAREDGAAGLGLVELTAVVTRSWKVLLVAALLGAVIAGVISLQMRKIYRAQTLIAPVTQNNSGMNGALGQFGGLAALAGIDLGSATSRKEEYFATLSSMGFARDFIVAEHLLPVLFADDWDTATKRWRDPRRVPTLEAGVKKFTDDVRFVTEDRRTGLVTVAIEWYSPEVAAAWANRMVEMVNDRLRAESTRNADRSIEYLNKELAKTNVVELQQAIYRLIETQVNNSMLANVQREYAFRVLDPAVPPELRIRPQRTLMVIAGAFVALILATLAILAWRVLRHRPA